MRFQPEDVTYIDNVKKGTLRTSRASENVLKPISRLPADMDQLPAAKLAIAKAQRMAVLCSADFANVDVSITDQIDIDLAADYVNVDLAIDQL